MSLTKSLLVLFEPLCRRISHPHGMVNRPGKVLRLRVRGFSPQCLLNEIHVQPVFDGDLNTSRTLIDGNAWSNLPFE